jgi:hypothetical protein
VKDGTVLGSRPVLEFDPSSPTPSDCGIASNMLIHITADLFILLASIVQCLFDLMLIN